VVVVLSSSWPVLSSPGWSPTGGESLPVFYCACAERITFLFPVQYLPPKFEILMPWIVSYLTKKCRWHLHQDLCVFGAKTGFCNTNFRNLGLLNISEYFRQNPQQANPYTILYQMGH